MSSEQLINIGIPLVVTLISYLTFRWADGNQQREEPLIDSEPLIHQGFEPKL